MPEPITQARPRFFSNLLTILGGQTACALLGIGIEIFYARAFGADGRGVVGLCFMSIAACVMLGGLGIDTPALTWAADRGNRPADWLPGVLAAGVLGSLIAGTLWIFLYWRWRPEFLKGITPGMAWLVLATVPCAIFFGYLMAIISGLERFRLRTGITLFEQLAGLVALCLFVLLLGRKPELAVAANLLAIVVSTALCVITIRDYLRLPPDGTPVRKQMFAAVGIGVPVILGNLATFFNYRLDVFIVNYFLNPAAVGIYALGVVVSEALWQIPRATALALFPRTARTAQAENGEFTCLVIRQVFLIACITGLLIAAASPILVPLVFGPRFAPSVYVIWWILPGTVTLSVAKIMCADLAGRKKPQYASLFAFVSLILTVVLDFAWIPKHGYIGAAMASSASYIVNSVLIAIVLKKELNVSWRAFVIPHHSEWNVYLQLWNRYRARIFPPALGSSPSG